MKQYVLLAAIAMYGAGCGFHAQKTDLKAQADKDTVLPGSEVTDDLAQKIVGNYALRTQYASLQNLPVLGQSSSLATTLSFVQIVRADQGLALTEEVCQISISSSSPVLQTVPEALTRSIGPQTSRFRLWQEQDQVRFVKDPAATIIGAKLTQADTEALPTQASDPRVFDQDGDGRPGVTVKVSSKLLSGEVYLVQRLKNTWTGTLSADGVFTGLFEELGEQSIIDASSALLKTKIPVTSDPDKTKSVVRLVKLQEDTECSQLKKDLTQIFK